MNSGQNKIRPCHKVRVIAHGFELSWVANEKQLLAKRGEVVIQGSGNHRRLVYDNKIRVSSKALLFTKFHTSLGD